MSRVLVQFAHPALEKSRVHQLLLQHIRHLEGITVNDLYQRYPEFDVDVRREQDLMLTHDVILWQHPFYWYSAPALVKQWQDLVLEHGWAYGRHGKILAGKKCGNVLSAGGSQQTYCAEGQNTHSFHEFLLPFRQTALLCSMSYLPPFVIPGTHRLEKGDIELFALQYEEILIGLRDDRFSDEELAGVPYLNDLSPIPKSFS